jgi:hypothetical protein
MITVNVKYGNISQRFDIHKSFVCYYSPFFDTTFAAGSQTLAVLDLKPEVFSIFVHWIYFQELAYDENNPPSMDKLVDLWFLARKFQIPRLQNFALAAMDHRRVHFNERLSCYHRIYRNTAEGSPFRRYAVQVAVMRYWYGGNIDAEPEDYPKEMRRDLVVFLGELEEEMPEGWERSLWEGFSENELNEFYVSD